MILHGDCLEKLQGLPDNSVDAVVTDPPYGLGKEPDPVEVMRAWCAGEVYKPKGSGFMGKEWDAFVPGPEIWRECLRVLKPGGHILSFFGTRTYDWGVMALRFAGFEVRDCVSWLYGSGFPKSTRINRWGAFCQCASNKHNSASKDPLQDEGDHRRMADASVDGDLLLANDQRLKNKSLDSRVDYHLSCDLDDALVRASEAPGLTSSQRQQCALTHSHSVGLDDDRASVSSRTLSGALHSAHLSSPGCLNLDSDEIDAGSRTFGNSKPADTSQSSSSKLGNFQGLSSKNGLPECLVCGKPNADGLGTALKPANEPIVLARKPLSEKTVAANVLKHGTGGINVDQSRIDTNGEKLNSHQNLGNAYSHSYKEAGTKPTALPTHTGHSQGRFPANLILDEDAAAALDEQSGVLSKQGSPKKKDTGDSAAFGGGLPSTYFGDSGGASRFFYVAKASKRERGEGNGHPTVKPIKLMEYLIRLVTPEGGTVLDPFMGSGTTGVAAKRLGFSFIGIEREAQYVEIAERRIEAALQ